MHLDYYDYTYLHKYNKYSTKLVAAPVSAGRNRVPTAHPYRVQQARECRARRCTLRLMSAAMYDIAGPYVRRDGQAAREVQYSGMQNTPTRQCTTCAKPEVWTSGTVVHLASLGTQC